MQLSKILDGVKTTNYADVAAESVTCDSREVEPGDVFVAVGGGHHKSDFFIADALRRGAVAVVTDAKGDIPAAIRVDDAESAASRIFSNYYGDPTKDMTVVAVTGTNGKTSVTGTLSAVLSAAGEKVGTLGTVGFMATGDAVDREEFFSEGAATMTTPGVRDLFKASARMRDGGCTAAVVEASSHALAAKRFDAAKIDLGIFTNLTPEHLDRHGDMENYFKAKASLVPLSRAFIANCDDAYGARLYTETGSLGFSARGAFPSDVLAARASGFAPGADGVVYNAETPRGKYRVFTPQAGEFALYNTLAAFAASCELGVDETTALGAIAKYPGVCGRMEKVALGDGFPAVYIDYAHTPDALDEALKCVRGFSSGRVILVFGCGGERDRAKRAPMGRTAHRFADVVFLTSDNPRSEDRMAIISDVLDGNTYDNFTVIPDRAEAIAAAIACGREEDVVLLAGKGHEKYVIDKCGKRYFDEREVLKDAVCSIRRKRTDDI